MKVYLVSVWVKNMPRLNYDFFARPTEQVAKELIGKQLVIAGQKAIITETEAYKGRDDPASHAFRGPTPRAKIMYGPCAQLYVYLIYGMYHCLNIVAHEDDEAGAVLIRGLELENLDLNGPGKLCRHFGITREFNHLDITDSPLFYVQNTFDTIETSATSRIGIKKGHDKLWRFIRN